MSDQEKELGVLRQQIDAIDKQIHHLLNDRARCAQQVAEVKLKYQGETDVVFYRPEREAQVLRRVMDRNDGPLPDKAVAGLFREVMSVCLALEEPMRVAFLGPAGTFTQQAALKHFGHSTKSVPLGSLNEVFREVQAGNAHYGVVPIENSTEGVVSHTLDLFKRYDLSICGEVELPIHHHLLLKENGERHHITRVLAHQQSLAQCREWLDQNLPQAERVAVSSNGEAARLLAQSDDTVAAIAGDMAAELYQLQVAERNIEDQPDNRTRFLIIANQEVGPSGVDKTSILISTKNKPGALYQLLEPFYRNHISLTRVETRSLHSGCLFYIDFEGHHTDAAVQVVLDELSAGSDELKLLGSYPCAVL
ncbi:MAG: prephenate dehydratase [Pontibacterium sp.]